jgi:hypothetical protein
MMFVTRLCSVPTNPKTDRFGWILGAKQPTHDFVIKHGVRDFKVAEAMVGHIGSQRVVQQNIQNKGWFDVFQLICDHRPT